MRIGQWKVPQKLIALSKYVKTWPAVLSEWRLDRIIVLAHKAIPQPCLCEHSRPRCQIHLKNVENNKTAILGRTCFARISHNDRHYQGLKKTIDSLKKIQKKIGSSANFELVNYAYLQKAITGEEFLFYSDLLKRTATPEDQQQKEKINEKIIALFQTTPESDLPKFLDEYPQLGISPKERHNNHPPF